MHYKSVPIYKRIDFHDFLTFLEHGGDASRKFLGYIESVREWFRDRRERFCDVQRKNNKILILSYIFACSIAFLL